MYCVITYLNYSLHISTISNSILGNNCKIKIECVTSKVEGVVCLCEVVAVGAGHGCWVVLVCHIGDEESVPNVRVHPSHIQREWSIP